MKLPLTLNAAPHWQAARGRLAIWDGRPEQQQRTIQMHGIERILKGHMLQLPTSLSRWCTCAPQIL
eukprot:704702-Amphidinium_carterae.1